MMLDRLLLNDIKEEIMEMQYEINATYNPPAPVIPAPVSEFNEIVKTPKTPKFDHELLLSSPQKSPMLSPGMKSNPSPMGMLQSPNMMHIHQNQVMLSDPHHKYPNSLHSPISAASPYMMPNSPLMQQQQSERFPSCMHQNKQSTGPINTSSVSQQMRPLMVSSSPHSSGSQKHLSTQMTHNRFYQTNEETTQPRKSKKSKNQIPVPVPEEPKKDLDNFDIESEITPSFIMKNAPVATCHEDPPKSPIITQNHSHASLQDTEDTLASSSDSPMKDMNNSSAGSDDMDIDYFGNPPHPSTTNTISDFDRLKNESTRDDTSNKIHENQEDQEDEPYDEWLCIQKALEEHNTRPLGHHLDNRNGVLFQQQQQQTSHDTNKINESQFNQLFHNASSTNTNHDSKLTDSPPSPFAELFSSGDIAAGASNGSSNDSSVKETMGQMYGGDSEEISAKNNDIVESRLEALFEGELIY